MFALAVIGVFILIVAVIVYVEYRNEKAYQEERKKRSEERKKTKPPYDPKAKVQKPVIAKKEKAIQRKAATPGAKEKVKPETAKKRAQDTDSYELKEQSSVVTQTVKKETPPASKPKIETPKKPAEAKIPVETKKPVAVKKEVPKEKVTVPEVKQEKQTDLPTCKYPPFTYARLMEMGLSEAEAIEFTKELIPQINTQIPLIEEALEKEDYHSMERLTHSIKGSSTTVGTGGISDLLVECNTYLKTGTEKAIAEAYLKHLKHYAQELEKQFS